MSVITANASHLSPFSEEDGPFGRAFDPALRSPFGAEAADHPGYQELPITVECWVRLEQRAEANIVVACGYRQPVGWNIASNRWMILSAPETGHLRAYIEGGEPNIVASRTPIADGHWHFVCMVYENSSRRGSKRKRRGGFRVRLFVDGRRAADSKLDQRVAINSGERNVSEGPLMIGSYRPEMLDCSGLIADLRISSVARAPSAIPTTRLGCDEATIGLWHLDDYNDDQGVFPDASGSNNPARVIVSDPAAPVSLNDWDRRLFGVSTSPFDRDMRRVDWQVDDTVALVPDGPDSRSEGADEIRLDGTWRCQEVARHGVSEELMFADEAWAESFPAEVPCTVQAALLDAGRIKDPMLLRNSLEIQWVAEREWWLRREFAVPGEWRGKRIRLLFDGVDYRATFWVNGRRLGQHEGMWGGPDYDVTDIVQVGSATNVLMVQLDPAPPNFPDTFKNNVAYGWHYVKLITLGIWRSVRLQARGELELREPFLKTESIGEGGVRTQLSADIWNSSAETVQAELSCALVPKNFDGHRHRLTVPVELVPGANRIGLEGELPGAHLWWPVDLGDPNLYQFQCTIVVGGEASDRYRANWGARIVEARPIQEEPRPDRYNWQMVVNGRPVWIKGANWCLPDALLRLTRKRLARFVELARHARVQCVRVWGGGPIENDVLYDLFDEMGIMVQQEFSMLGFHRLQNVPTMHATDMTHYTVRRLRNRPSLVLWAGANEIRGQGRIVEVLGRRILELDGTRPFHRSCPYGGDTHFHIYWNQAALVNHHERAKTPFAFTEFGASSPADWETWKAILPSDEWQQWSPREDAVFIDHTPTFVYNHVHLMNRFAREYLEPTTLPRLIMGMQIAQSIADKFLIEGMRARKPETTMTHVYKLTENYPAASWATIDYYGRPKIAHHGLRDVHAPVHIMAVFDSWDVKRGKLPMTIHAVNDTSEPIEATACVRLFDGGFRSIEMFEVPASLPIDRAILLRDAGFEVPRRTERPLFLVLELKAGTTIIDRNWYFFDFVKQQGSLFNRPQTRVDASLAADDETIVTIANRGKVPALSVGFSFGPASDTWYAEESWLWLEPGEERRVILYQTEPIEGDPHPLDSFEVQAWNADPVVVRPTPADE